MSPSLKKHLLIGFSLTLSTVYAGPLPKLNLKNQNPASSPIKRVSRSHPEVPSQSRLKVKPSLGQATKSHIGKGTKLKLNLNSVKSAESEKSLVLADEARLEDEISSLTDSEADF